MAEGTLQNVGEVITELVVNSEVRGRAQTDTEVTYDDDQATGFGKRCLVEMADFKMFAIFSISHLAFFIIVSSVLIFTYSLIGRKVWRQNVFREKQKTNRRTLEVSSAVPEPSTSTHSPRSNGVSGRSQRQVENGATGNPKPETSSSLAKTTGTLFMVTLAYILSAIPHHLLSILFFVIPNFDCNLSLIGSQFFYVFIWSYMINSTLNPFIYGFRDTRFRREMKLIYRKY
ncbi:hypothetical protein FSP39_019530 [Pinctada imbricata]|uniref:G-protein coupled receptors family 1 profile domain-containing protein n=1 Tax=Pinctada imbricata TaxID=66713 RepID=A0AA88XN64_PINIB|nr:hypothetical protein FSP39_019530 [Pinctada imbricata]